MRTLLSIILFFVFPITSFSQKEMPEAIAETMSNTFNFYGDKLTGSCFMLVKNGMQFFVTAAHLFDSSHKSGTRSFYSNSYLESPAIFKC